MSPGGISAGIKQLTSPGSVEVKDAIGQQVLVTTTKLIVVREKGTQQLGVGNVSIVDEVAQFCQQGAEISDFFRGDDLGATSNDKRAPGRAICRRR